LIEVFVRTLERFTVATRRAVFRAAVDLPELALRVTFDEDRLVAIGPSMHMSADLPTF
jgi:hypothetical protein